MTYPPLSLLKGSRRQWFIHKDSLLQMVWVGGGSVDVARVTEAQNMADVESTTGNLLSGEPILSGQSMKHEEARLNVQRMVGIREKGGLGVGISL